MATISTEALQPTTTLPVTTVPDLSSQYANNINSVANLTQQANDAALAEKTAQDQYLAKANEKANLESSYGMKATDTANLYQSSGVNDLYKQISGLNTEAQGLSREAQAIPLALQNQSANRGVTVGGIAPIQAAQLRENALKSLELGQRAAIAQGNYDVAKNLADQQIASKYAGIDAEIKSKQTNLDALDKITLTAAQEKRKEAQTALLTKQANDVAEQKANDKAISDIIIQASTQNAPANLLEKAKLAKTPAAAAMILGQYAGDYYKTELLKNQIATEKAQRAKIYNDISVANKKAETITDINQFNPLNFKDASARTAFVTVKGVLNAVSDLKKSAPSGDFAGLGFLGGSTRDYITSAEGIKNRAYLNAVNLKVQQWASGASLTEQQTEMVNKLVPSVTDSDRVIGDKLDALAGYMNNEASSIASSQGQSYQAPITGDIKVDNYLNTVNSAYSNMGTQPTSGATYAQSLYGTNPQ